MRRWVRAISTRRSGRRRRISCAHRARQPQRSDSVAKAWPGRDVRLSSSDDAKVSNVAGAYSSVTAAQRASPSQGPCHGPVAACTSKSAHGTSQPQGPVVAQLTDQQRIRAGVAGLVAGLRLVALCQGLLSGGPETNRSVAAAGAHCPSRSHSISARVTVASQPPTSCHRYGRCCRPHPSDSCRDAFPPLPPCACACAFAYAFACAGRCARARLLAVERVVEEAELDEARGIAAGGPRRAARRRANQAAGGECALLGSPWNGSRPRSRRKCCHRNGKAGPPRQKPMHRHV